MIFITSIEQVCREREKHCIPTKSDARDVLYLPKFNSHVRCVHYSTHREWKIETSRSSAPSGEGRTQQHYIVSIITGKQERFLMSLYRTSRSLQFCFFTQLHPLIFKAAIVWHCWSDFKIENITFTCCIYLGGTYTIIQVWPTTCIVWCTWWRWLLIDFCCSNAVQFGLQRYYNAEYTQTNGLWMNTGLRHKEWMCNMPFKTKQ